MDDQADIKEWLAKVKNLGFDAVELSYKVTEEQVAEVNKDKIDDEKFKELKASQG